MVGPTLAIARLAIHQAIRSRVVLSLLGILLLAVFLLPLTIEGDGTLQGDLHVRLLYPLRAIQWILSIAVLWASASAISTEIENRRLFLVACKPVPRSVIWLGKWLGLLSVQASLLLLAGGALIAVTLVQFARQPLDPSAREQLTHEFLTAREPLPLTVEPPTETAIAAWIEARQAVEGALPAPPVEIARAALEREARTIAPGETRTWDVPITIHDARHPLVVRTRLAASSIGSIPIPGEWSIQWNGGEDARWSVTNAANRTLSLITPPPPGEGPQQLRIEYRQLATDGTKALLPANNGIVLMNYRGSFLANTLKSLCLLFFQLAFLAAIGLTAGTLFSLPVAVLVSSYGLILLQARDYVARSVATGIELGDIGHHHAPHAPADNLLIPMAEQVIGFIFQILHLLLNPLETPAFIPALARGEWISPAAVAQSGAVRLLLYAGLLAALGAWLFHRRELAEASGNSG